jgi:two-component system OmpR family response regulator
LHKRIIIIDHTPSDAKLMADELQKEGFSPVCADSYEEATAIIETHPADLVLIDWESAEAGFFDFVVSIKRQLKKVAVVVISDKSGKNAEIDALNNGADDYTPKPIHEGRLDSGYYGVMLSRIEARLRFGGTNVIDVGELVIDPDEEKIYYKTKEIELKGKPFEVLTHLARHRDQIVSKEQLLDAIWEEPELVTPNVIEVAINQIRQKMDKPLGIGTIETVRRRGYRFCFPNCSGQTITDQ